MSISETLDITPSRDVGHPHSLGTRNPPALVVVLECHRPTSLGCRLVLGDLEEVVVARNSVGRIERGARSATIYVGDSQTSRQHLAIRRRSTAWWLDDLGSKNGTVVNGEPATSARLADGDVIEAGGTILMYVHDAGDGTPVADRVLAAGDASSLTTLNAELERRFHQLRKIAPAPVPVLVRGETGTGKELTARAIHDASGRRGPFVPVNCGALPRGLIESELFGHRRGAFSGASDDHEGLVRRAHGGTLFLDEIAELPADSQVALLRVLQDGEVRPVGASEALTVDVRVVAATHQDLQKRITDGRFRQDLYGRIAGFEIAMPALRDRREDLGLLIAAILSKVCPDPERVTLSKAAARALLHHTWPLNIRELEQTLRSAVGLADGGEICLEHLPETIRGRPAPEIAMSPKDRALREQLIALLHEAHGNVAAVGRAMQRAPVQIRRWCNRLQIDLHQFR